MTTEVTHTAGQPDVLQAAGDELLATVEPCRWGAAWVRYPADLAAASVEMLVRRTQGVEVTAIDEPDMVIPKLGRLGEARWAVRCPRRATRRVSAVLIDAETRQHGPTMTTSTHAYWVYSRHCVLIQAAWEMEGRLSLELVKPERLDERGLPMSWVAPTPPTTTLGADRVHHEHVETVPEGPPLPELPPEQSAVRLAPDDTASVRAALRALCRQLGFGDVALEVLRPAECRDGFVVGRVWMAPSGPRKVRVEIGPNADAAEVWATLVHELAHAVDFEPRHGRAFQGDLLQVAEARFGAAWFGEARRHLGAAHHLIDAWVAVGIRAALRQGSVPVREQHGDEGQLARIVTRIRKLRRLALSQAGTPEGRSACAKANDLLVRWDLGTYSVRLSSGIDEQMCDRWVEVGKRAVWRRQLAFEVSRYCGVFALTRASRGWMHFFGRHADVITAEWFFEIWSAHIERRAEAHLADFKKARKQGRTTGNTRSERTNFCDSAVLALSKKLDGIAGTHDEDAVHDEQIQVRRLRAEDFAAVEHSRRGKRWRAGSGKRIQVNHAGLAAGQAAPMGRGVGVGPGVQGLLGKS